MSFCLPENCKIIEGLSPRIGTTVAMTGDYVSMKNFEKLYIVIHYQGADGVAETFGVMESPLVSGVGAQASPALFRIWSDLACATSDLLVERTAAASYAINAVAANKIVIFEVDPAALTEGYDCVAGYTTSGLAVTETISMLYIGVPRVQSRVLTSATALTD